MPSEKGGRELILARRIEAFDVAGNRISDHIVGVNNRTT
jgi:hypothetical protein